jgi:TonB family protein
MTLHRALLLSFTFHILFGVAFAIVHTGHMLGRADVITVALVGAGSASEASPRKNIASQDSESKHLQLPAHNNEVSRIDDKEGVKTLRSTEATQVAKGQIRSGDVKQSDEQSATNQQSGGEQGSQFGILTIDKWQLIQLALESAKTYPRMARERGIEGVVRVRFKVLPSGNIERVEILQSSGSEILDTASIKTVHRAKPLPYVNGWVEVPISYSILK